jgi:DnaK suppressor protein
MSMLKKAEVDQFRQVLLLLKARVDGDVQQLTREALDRGEGGGDPKSPTHLAELGSQAFEQEFSLRFVQNDQEILNEISAALKRIEDGTFGLCQSCLGEGRTASKAAIPKARLRVIPYARNCVACERKREQLSL